MSNSPNSKNSWRKPSAVYRRVFNIYRLCVSPLLGPACRFTPTCSAYAEEALIEHGPIKGGLLAIRRILRCHPLGGHGHDPVIPAIKKGIH